MYFQYFPVLIQPRWDFYCLHPFLCVIFWGHWILVASVKAQADIWRMKGFPSIKHTSASLLRGSPVHEEFLATVWPCHGALPVDGASQGVVCPIALAQIKKYKNITIGHWLQHSSWHISFCFMTPCPIFFLSTFTWIKQL